MILAQARHARPCLLFAEDFDEPARPEPQAAPPPAAPSYSENEMQAARADAAATARAAALSGMEAAHAEAVRQGLAAIAAELAASRDAAATHAEQAIEALAGTLLATLRAALPDLCARHGEAEARAMLAALRPALATETRIGIELAPRLQAELASELARLREELPGEIVLRANAALPEGDVRVTWQDGMAARDVRATLAAIDAALGLGLLDITETTHVH